jgi:hypothetical protein
VPQEPLLQRANHAFLFGRDEGGPAGLRLVAGVTATEEGLDGVAAVSAAFEVISEAGEQVGGERGTGKELLVLLALGAAGHTRDAGIVTRLQEGYEQKGSPLTRGS